MKLISSSISSLAIIGGLITSLHFVHAQTTAKAVQSVSADDMNVMLQAVEETTPQAAESVPKSGTFYSAQFPNWPPLPCNINNVPVWNLGDGVFLLSDLDVNYSQRPMASSMMAGNMMAMSAPMPGDVGDSGTNTFTFNESGFTVDYGTNLWIAQVGISSGSLVGIVSNSLADISYEIQSLTDLAQAGAGWNSEGFILGSELTNWTPMSVAQNGRTNLFLRIRSWADDGSGLPIWWQMQYFGTTGVDPNAQDPAGDGWTIWQDFEAGYDPTVFHTPPAPQNLTLQMNNTGLNANLSWQSGGGNVSQYRVEEVYPYGGSTVLGTVSASQTNFSTALDQVYYGTEYNAPAFRITALFTNGASSASAMVYLESVGTPLLQIVRNSQGQFKLVTGHLPLDAVTIRLFWVEDIFDEANNPHYDVPVSNIVNGVYTLPGDVLETYAANYTTWMEILHTSGQYDWEYDTYPELASVNVTDWPAWLNTSAQVLKDNLHFLLRSATVNHSFSYGSYFPEPYENDYPGQTLSRPETGAAYEYSGYYDYDAYQGKLVNEPIRPMDENYLWRNFAYVDGDLNTGASYSGGRYIGSQPEYEIQSANLPPNAIPSPLLTDSTTSFYFYSLAGYAPYTEIGLGVDVNNNVYLPDGVQNLYGLRILAVKGYSGAEVDAGAPATFTLDTLGPAWYVESALPSLTNVDYYFASQTPHDNFGSPLMPAPSVPGFSPTNTSPLLITGVGQSIGVMGWAKQAIQNGYANKFAYLEQFFDQAYQINTNGIATTNTTGVLSSYGQFFATQPGPAALVTMPDVDTGARGTCTVNCFSMPVDKNSDGNMDLSFSGPDATSQASPYKVWVNNSHTIPGTGSNLDHDVETPRNTSPNYSAGQITCQRDLENFFRLWICGVPSLWLSWNYTFTMSMSPSSGNPAINLYESCETNGGTGYLTDTNIAAQQIANGYGVSMGTVSNNCPCTIPSILFAFGGTQHFLFEGAGIGSGELVLTISQNGNTIAQTGVWLDLHDIKDLYEQANAENVTNGLPPSSLVSQCQIDHVTVAAPDETKQVIVFVHGINNTLFDYYDSTETLFKRLYWSGYHGKVVGFRWPCAYLPFDNTLNPFDFDLGEFYAWKSASAFKDYLNYLKNRPDLAGYQIDIIAHSQGNVVVSEAVKQGAPFDNYILTQGAIPAHCYDTSVQFLQKLLDADADSPTPFYPTNGGYHGYFASLTGNLINFYNTNDYALAKGTWNGLQANWEADQENEKPENFAYRLGQDYNYDPLHFISTASYTFSGYTVTDPYEIMSMVARSRTRAIGAEDSAAGVINTNASVDLRISFGFGNTRDEHSAQFTRPIQTVWGYYDQVLSSFRIQHIAR